MYHCVHTHFHQVVLSFSVFIGNCRALLRQLVNLDPAGRDLLVNPRLQFSQLILE